MKRYIILLLMLLTSCAKMTGLKVGGDDQLVKGEIDIENMKNTAAEIDDLGLDVTAQGQAGVGNRMSKTSKSTDMKIGGDSVFNSPEMINKGMVMIEKLVRYGAITIVAPFLLIILGFVIILVVMNYSSNKRYAKQSETIKCLINNMSTSLDKLMDVLVKIDKENNDDEI